MTGKVLGWLQFLRLLEKLANGGIHAFRPSPRLRRN